MTKFGIGQAVRRVEDQRFTTGTGQYVGDFVLAAAMLWRGGAFAARACASSSASTWLRRKRRRACVCVLTGADAVADKIGGIPPFFMPESWGGPKGFSDHAAGPACRPRPLRRRPRRFRRRRNRGAGARCRRAGRRRLRAAAGGRRSRSRRRKPRAPKIWDDCPNGNVAVTIAFGDKAATDAAFAEAKHVASVRLVNNRVTANPIEPRCAIGVYDAADGRYTLHTTSQDPHSVRAALSSAVLHVPESKIRVISPDVGGGFGMKANLLSRRRPGAVGGQALRPAGQMDRDAQRKSAVRQPRARSDRLWRARARRERQISRHPVDRLSGARRLLVGGGDRAAVLVADVRPEPLRRADDRHQHQRRVHQHRADFGLSRRRPAGGDLSDRASGRSRRAGHRHRPRRVAAAQPDQAGGAALSHADASQLRQRRVREADGQVPRRSPIGTASPRGAKRASGAASCAAAR